MLQNSAMSGSVFGRVAAASLSNLDPSKSGGLDFRNTRRNRRCNRPTRDQAAPVSKTQNATVLPKRNNAASSPQDSLRVGRKGEIPPDEME